MNIIYSITFFLGIFIINFQILVAQGCEDKGIKTDPRNNTAFNIEKPSAENHFNWMNGPNYIIQPNVNLTPTYIESPYHTQSPLKPFYDAARGTNSDYYPEDGWELLKVNLGRLNDDVTFRQNASLPIAYVILYNRFTGLMRLFGTINTKDEHDDIVVKISYEHPTTGNHLNYSGILSLNDGISNPLDSEIASTETEYNHITKYSCNTATQFFFWSDFNLSYDPCVCNYKSNLNITFSTIDSSEMTLAGTMMTQPKPVVKNNSSGFGVVEATKLSIGVASIVTAIATQGAVVNVGGIVGIFDLFTGSNSALTQDEKNSLLLVKAFLELGGDIYNLHNNAGPTTVDYVDASGVTQTKVLFTKEAKKQGLDVFAKYDKFFASAAKIGATSGGTSGASASTSAIKLDGYMYDSKDYEDAVIRFSTPGSLDSENNPQENVNNITDAYQNVRPEYVAYNEILGTMTLLKTPQMDYLYQIIDAGLGLPGLSLPYNEYKLNENLQYTFNPIMHLNASNTHISVAFVAEYPSSWSSFTSLDPVLALCNQTRITGTSSFISNFLPIECFKEMTFGVFPNPTGNPNITPKLYLRFLVEAESFDIGTNGLPNKVLLIHTFPVKDGVGTPTANTQTYNSSQPNYYTPNSISMSAPPTNLNISTAQTYTSDAIIYSTGSITINANLATSNGVNVRIIAKEKIDVGNNVVIGSGISFEIASVPYVCNSPMPEMTRAYVNNFCNTTNSSYNSHTLQGGARYTSEQEVASKQTKATFELYPNPTTRDINLRFVQMKEGTISYELYNLTGQKLKAFTSTENYPIGESEVEIRLDLLQSGIYLCHFTDSEGKTQIQKFIKE